MPQKFKIGEMVYILDARTITQVQITHIRGNYYTVKRLDKKSAFTIPEHRIYKTEDEIRKAQGIKEPENKNYRPPFLH